jgi:uncharacterized protein YabN with tetrapyrrole methylase and pyrophosphatase domain
MMALAPSPDNRIEASFDRLRQIVAVLRGDGGCPWDKRQTPATLKHYLIEECRELAEAIDGGQKTAIGEEIGDVLFILTLLIAMHEEQGHFTTEVVLEGIIAKMIRRHPHVFAGQPIGDEQELRRQWERIKAEEKTENRP